MAPLLGFENFHFHFHF